MFQAAFEFVWFKINTVSAAMNVKSDELAFFESRCFFLIICVRHLFIKAATYLFVQLCAAMWGKGNKT